MKAIRRKAHQLFVFILIVFSVLLGITTFASAVEYEYIELPPGAIAWDINDSGAVVGAVYDGSTKGFLYSEGVYTELLPPGATSSRANGINDSGVVVGYGVYRYDGSTAYKGFLYSEGVYTELLPPGAILLNALDINNSGAVVGWVNDGTTSKGFLYSEGVYTDIIPPGWSNANASDINNSSAVVGYGYESINSDSKGFLYSEGVYTELLPPGATSSYANSINDSGVVVGLGVYRYDGSTTYKGFLYSKGVYTELLPGANAWNINDSGAVVGWVNDGTTSKGFLYSEGVYTDIIPPGWSDSLVLGINNSGTVIGANFYDITEKGFIATAIKTPLEQLQTIIEFFDNGVAGGSLGGIGRIQLFAAFKLKAFRNMLIRAQYLIENGYTEEACKKLKNLYKKIDGNPRPPDFIGGSAAPELAQKIDALIKDMNCL